MAFELVEQETFRTPDGTRPLEVGRPLRTLLPSYVDMVNGRPRPCYTARRCEQAGQPVPAWCRLSIDRGDHYLRHVEVDVAGHATGRVASYCAPCAVRDWSHWQVREIAP